MNRYPDCRDEAHGKHILKYIFPRQFGLHNPFTFATDRRETVHTFKDYTDREIEIAAAPKNRDLKVFRRLGPKVLPLISKMQKLHKQCSYHLLIHYYCSTSTDTANADDEISFGDAQERSKELTQKEISVTSARISDDNIAVNSGDCDIIRHYTPQHQVLFPQNTTHYKVIAFVNAVVKNIIPKGFFGSERNFALVLKSHSPNVRSKFRHRSNGTN